MRKSQTLSPASGSEKQPLFMGNIRIVGSSVKFRLLAGASIAQMVRANEKPESLKVKAQNRKVKTESSYLLKMKTETKKFFQILSKVWKAMIVRPSGLYQAAWPVN